MHVQIVCVMRVDSQTYALTMREREGEGEREKERERERESSTKFTHLEK